MDKLFFFFFCFSALFAKPAITYDFSGGRFGDNLLAYLHAKWIAQQSDLDLLYRPFQFSSNLAMHDRELHLDAEQKKYRRQVVLNLFQTLPHMRSENIFICPYFPEVEWEIETGNYYFFHPDWKNPEFRKTAREMIAPKHPLSLIYPPKDCVSVAMHIREGGGFDDLNAGLFHPVKMPPITYYVDALQRVLPLFRGAKIHCHVFTDALDPVQLLKRMQSACGSDPYITFSCRSENNHHDQNVLEDFFSLFNFDVLIRPDSNYSIVPSLIHDYAVVASPKRHSIVDEVVRIEEIRVAVEESIYRALCDRCGLQFAER